MPVSVRRQPDGNTLDTGRALEHYQQAIQYREREDNRYGAGWARYDAAFVLGNADRY